MDIQPKQVFISYASQEREYARQLKTVFELLGFTVWIDEEIAPRRAWRPEIRQYLSSASCVIVLWSRRAATSSWVRFEAAHASGRNVYLGCRIENGVVLQGPFDESQDAKLYGWTGSRTHNDFHNLLGNVEEMTGQRSNGVQLQEFATPWPEKVRNSTSEQILQWLRSNVTSVASMLVAIAALVMVYMALGQQLAEVRSATSDIAAVSEKTKAGLEKQLEEVRGTTRDIARVSATATDSLKQLRGDVDSISMTATKLALETTPIHELDLIFIGASPKANFRFSLGHGGVHLFDVVLNGTSTTAQRHRADGTTVQREVLNGEIRFSGKAVYELRTSEELYALIEAQRLNPNWRFDLGIANHPVFMRGPQATSIGDCIRLRINIPAMLNWIRVTQQELAADAKNPAQHADDPTKVYPPPLWPILSVRDLNDVDVRCRNSTCNAMAVGVNGTKWAILDDNLIGQKQPEWLGIGKGLVENVR